MQVDNTGEVQVDNTVEMPVDNTVEMQIDNTVEVSASAATSPFMCHLCLKHSRREDH